MSSYNESNNESITSSEQRLPPSFDYLSGRGFGSTSGKSYQPLGTSSGQKRAKSYLKQGLNKLSRGEYAAALKDFKQALRVDPNFIEAYICQSIVYYYQEDYQEAIATCNQVLLINPNHVDAYNNRGLNRCAMGEYKEAIADFNQVLAIDPHHAKAFLNRGYSRMQMDDNWGAIEDFDQALRLDPTSARLYLKQLADTLNREPEAINDPKEQLVQGLLIQANLRYEAGDYQEAIALYTQILNLDPTNTEAYNRRSTALSAMGQYEAAFQDLYQAADAYLGEQPQAATIAEDANFSLLHTNETNLAVTNFSLLPKVENTNFSLLPKIEKTVADTNLSSPPKIETNVVATNFYLPPKTEIAVEELEQQGVAKLQNGDFWGAIEAFNQVLQVKANDAKVLVCRGLAYRQLADNTRAIADLEQAVKLFSEQGDFKSSQQILDTLKKLRQ